jgi:hypothetical protein
VIELSTGNLAARVLECLLDPRGHAHASGEQGRAPPRGASPWLPGLVDSPAAEAVERVGPEGPAHGGADFVEVDADDLQELCVAWPRWFAQVSGQLGSEDVRVGEERIDRFGEEVSVQDECEEEMFGAQVVVTEAPCLFECRLDNSNRVRVAVVEHGSAPAPAPNVVLLMDGLTGDAQGLGDRLPRPAQASGVVDVQFFELLDEVAKRRDRGEADRGIAAVDCVVQIGQLPHGVSLG